MARNKLTERECKALNAPGIYGDGDGLYLRVNAPKAALPSSKNWVFVWRRKESGRHELGLGGYGQGTAPVSLSLAREKADAIRQQLARGEDPSRPRTKAKTFKDCVDLFLAVKRQELKSVKSLAGWELTLNEYAKPLHDLAVAKVSVDDVVSCVEPHWQIRPETADRLRARIANVIDYARARGLREAGNPAQWHGLLDKILPPRQKLTRGHHKALPYLDMPRTAAALRYKDLVSARAAEFAILTVGRSEEVRGALWSEIDFGGDLWVIPAARMKMRRDHRVPLTARAIEILRKQETLATGLLVFNGGTDKRPISDTAVVRALRAAAGDNTITLHGVRSSFHDWAADTTAHEEEVVELSLAHVAKGVKAAYRRGDAIDKRRALMDDWAAYCQSKTSQD